MGLGILEGTEEMRRIIYRYLRSLGNDRGYAFLELGRLARNFRQWREVTMKLQPSLRVGQRRRRPRDLCGLSLVRSPAAAALLALHSQ